MSEETLKQPEVAAEAAPIAASDAAEGAAEGAEAPAKKVRAGKSIPAGIAFIRSTFDNTQVSIADARGGVIAWSSAGKAGFKGSRKSTAFAATMVAQVCSIKKKLEKEENLMKKTIPKNYLENVEFILNIFLMNAMNHKF